MGDELTCHSAKARLSSITDEPTVVKLSAASAHTWRTTHVKHNDSAASHLQPLTRHQRGDENRDTFGPGFESGCAELRRSRTVIDVSEKRLLRQDGAESVVHIRQTDESHCEYANQHTGIDDGNEINNIKSRDRFGVRKLNRKYRKKYFDSHFYSEPSPGSTVTDQNYRPVFRKRARVRKVISKRRSKKIVICSVSQSTSGHKVKPEEAEHPKIKHAYFSPRTGMYICSIRCRQAISCRRGRGGNSSMYRRNRHRKVRLKNRSQLFPVAAHAPIEVSEEHRYIEQKVLSFMERNNSRLLASENEANATPESLFRDDLELEERIHHLYGIQKRFFSHYIKHRRHQRRETFQERADAAYSNIGQGDMMRLEQPSGFKDEALVEGIRHDDVAHDEQTINKSDSTCPVLQPKNDHPGSHLQKKSRRKHKLRRKTSSSKKLLPLPEFKTPPQETNIQLGVNTLPQTDQTPTSLHQNEDTNLYEKVTNDPKHSLKTGQSKKEHRGHRRVLQLIETKDNSVAPSPRTQEATDWAELNTQPHGRPKIKPYLLPQVHKKTHFKLHLARPQHEEPPQKTQAAACTPNHKMNGYPEPFTAGAHYPIIKSCSLQERPSHLRQCQREGVGGDAVVKSDIPNNQNKLSTHNYDVKETGVTDLQTTEPFHQQLHSSLQAFDKRKWRPLTPDMVPQLAVTRCRPVSGRHAASSVPAKPTVVKQASMYDRPPSRGAGGSLTDRRSPITRVDPGPFDTLTPAILSQMVDSRSMTPTSHLLDSPSMTPTPHMADSFSMTPTSETFDPLSMTSSSFGNRVRLRNHTRRIFPPDATSSGDESDRGIRDMFDDSDSLSELERGREPSLDPHRKIPELNLRPENADDVYIPANKRDMRRFDFDAENTEVPEYPFKNPVPFPLDKISFRYYALQNIDWRLAHSATVLNDLELCLFLDRLVDMEKRQASTIKWEERRYKRFKKRKVASGAGKSRDKRCCNPCLQPACVGDCPVKKAPPDCCEKCRQSLCTGNCTETKYEQRMRQQLDEPVVPASTSTPTVKSCKTCQIQNPAKNINSQHISLGRPKSALTTFSRAKASSKPKSTRPSSAEPDLTSKRSSKKKLDLRTTLSPAAVRRKATIQSADDMASGMFCINQSLTDLSIKQQRFPNSKKRVS